MSDLAHAPDAVDVAVLLFEGVELLDFAGPFEALAVAGRPDGPLRCRVRSVGVNSISVRARCGPTLVADESDAELDTRPPHAIIVPGGFGVRALLDDERFIDRLRTLHQGGAVIASVCTGAWLLAKARLLDGRAATTHHLGLDRLRELAPQCRVEPKARVVDTGDVVTAGGISAGVDLGIHLIARWCGDEVADATATYLEWKRS